MLSDITINDDRICERHNEERPLTVFVPNWSGLCHLSLCEECLREALTVIANKPKPFADPAHVAWENRAHADKGVSNALSIRLADECDAPLPWKVVPTRHGGCWIKDSEGKAVAYAGAGYSKENALVGAEIVRTMNCHEQALDALKMWWDAYGIAGPSQLPMSECLHDTEMVLREAGMIVDGT